MGVLTRLSELRKEKHLRQVDVADALHINQNTLSRYEDDLREPDITVLIKFADYYRVSLDFLVRRSNDNWMDDIAVNSIPKRMAVGNYIREVRKAKNLSQTFVAESIGMWNEYLSDIERGIRLPPVDYIGPLANVLEMTDEERYRFYDLLAKADRNCYFDINQYLSENELARKCIRLLMKRDDHMAIWQKLYIALIR